MNRIIIDAFFHTQPGHRLSRNIFVGGYRTNYGRYSLYDVYHPNGASMLYSDLLADFDVKLSTQPFSEMTLAEADILMVPNPDYPLYEGSSPYRIDEPDVQAVINFLNRGGSVILMINSFLSKSDFWEENFDFERITPLLEKFGIKWDHNFMSDDHVILPAKCGDITVGYGQGGRVVDPKLPAGAEPILTYEGQVFGFSVRHGTGRIAVVGDAGLVSNGLYHFPGFENAKFLAKLFSEMTPAWGKAPASQFESFEFGHVSCCTSELGVSEKLFKSLRPKARFEIDHHYRHLTYEAAPVALSSAEALAKLPVSLGACAGKKSVQAKFSYVNVGESLPTAGFEATLNISQKVSATGTDYVIAGTTVNESASWADIGADPAVFGKIGSLVRVNTIIQILAGLNPDGSLRYFTMKQGQILYARNKGNPHLGFDIVLNSRNCVFSPCAKA